MNSYQMTVAYREINLIARLCLISYSLCAATNDLSSNTIFNHRRLDGLRFYFERWGHFWLRWPPNEPHPSISHRSKSRRLFSRWPLLFKLKLMCTGLQILYYNWNTLLDRTHFEIRILCVLSPIKVNKKVLFKIKLEIYYYIHCNTEMKCWFYL